MKNYPSATSILFDQIVCDGIVIDTDIDSIYTSFEEVSKDENFMTNTMGQISNLASFVWGVKSK